MNYVIKDCVQVPIAEYLKVHNRYPDVFPLPSYIDVSDNNVIVFLTDYCIQFVYVVKKHL